MMSCGVALQARPVARHCGLRAEVRNSSSWTVAI
jgi:hypothetical protein